MKIGTTPIGPGNPVFVIAEIGINHNGSLLEAIELCREAAAAGANAVKFQKRTVDVVYTPEELARPRESPFGSTNGDLKRVLELSSHAYRAIAAECRKLGLYWGVSPWDVASVDCFLDPPDFLKVASACLTDRDLLLAIKNTGLPVIASTGMSTLDEIDEACRFLDLENTALLHCCSAYPAPLAELNLRAIRFLQQRYPQAVIGYSGHERPPYPDVTLAAIALGATVVERHLTLYREQFGSDQAASLEPDDLRELVASIRALEPCLGSVLDVTPSEIPIRDKLRRKNTLFSTKAAE